MAKLNMVQAINMTLQEQMRKDDRIVVLGEDVGKNGGVFRVTEGLYDEFGSERVMDTPLSESGIVGTAIGMAIYGLRPVAEIQFMDFVYPGFDQIVNELAKIRYRTGGQFYAPVIIRMPCGGGIRGGPYHSQSSEAYFVHTAGLKVIMPSTPYDARGIMLAALRQDDPVIFLEPKKLYRAFTQEVPDEEYIVPIGEARVVREGNDVSVFTYGAMVAVSEEAARLAEKDGIGVEVIDLRSLLPMDMKGIISSVQKTGRAMIVHEAPKTGGLGAEISAMISERAMLDLRGPILRVTGFDTPFPFALESFYLPDPPRVMRAVKKLMEY